MKDFERNLMLRLAEWSGVVLALVVTLRYNVFTLTQISRAGTRVPWADEWLMVQEFASWKRGGSLWRILWSPYWGHRLVVPRLIFFADMQWASHASLIWLTMAIQLAHMGMLIALAWLLLRRASPIRFALACVAVLNLMLSPSQMENFTWSMQTMFPLVYAAGTAAILCLTISRRMRPLLFLILSVVAALTASLTMPNGILVWPVLVVQGIYLRLGRRVTQAIGFLGAAIIALYLWHYERPALGMGIGGMLRHPIDALMLTGLLLGAPFDSLPTLARISVALLTIAATVYLAARVLRSGRSGSAWDCTIVAINAFLLLGAASVVAGRLGPDWLHNTSVLPSRYFTLICAFWSSVAILTLYALSQRLIGVVSACWWAGVFVVLMFFQPSHLLERAEDWADFFRGADAMGAALLIGAPDEQMLRYLLDSPRIRDEGVAFMREERMGVFGEWRSAWLGKQISELWPIDSASRCIGSVEFSNQLTQPGAGAWRIEGWAVNQRTDDAIEDLVVTAPGGAIAGLARGGLRHRYIPAFITDAKIPVFHAGVRSAEWLGYMSGIARPWVVWGVGAKGVCRVAEIH